MLFSIALPTSPPPKIAVSVVVISRMIGKNANSVFHAMLTA